MGWEVYNRGFIRTGEPSVTITKMGRIAINMSATALFESKKAAHVVILWDIETAKCAIRIAAAKDEGAYVLTYNPKSNGSGFSAVTFLNYIRYDWTKTRAFQAEWDESSQMLIFAIPREHLGKRVPEGYMVRGGGGIKRADRVKKEEDSELKNQEATEVTS